MKSWYELHKSANGQFNFVLKMDDGHVLLRSEQYESKGAAQNGINSVQANCSEEARYERKESVDNRWYFNLKAANHQVIGTSTMYSTAQLCDDEIEMLKACGGTATVTGLS
jgi:hypothetical protein